MRKLALAFIGSIAVVGCGDGEDEPVDAPGLLPPSCTMTWAPYAVTAVDLGADHTEVLALSLDIDERENDGNDNMIGTLMSSMKALFPETWDPQTAFDAKLAAGEVRWVLEVGTCADGDEVRVVSARAVDADGDGRLEIVDRGLASVGFPDSRGTVKTVRGIGWVPVGSLFGPSPTAGTDAWQRGLSLTTDLAIADEAVDGRFAIGLIVDTPEVLTPVQNFFNERLDGGASQTARDMDANMDGTISFEENRDTVLDVLTLDLHLGTCDDVSCYLPRGAEGVNDHASLGIGVHAERVTLE